MSVSPKEASPKAAPQVPMMESSPKAASLAPARKIFTAATVPWLRGPCLPQSLKFSAPLGGEVALLPSPCGDQGKARALELFCGSAKVRLPSLMLDLMHAGWTIRAIGTRPSAEQSC